MKEVQNVFSKLAKKGDNFVFAVATETESRLGAYGDKEIVKLLLEDLTKEIKKSKDKFVNI